MKLLLILTLCTLPLSAHENILSIGGDLNGGATLSYHRLHFEQDTIGFYGNISYKDESIKKQSSIDKIISELITTTEEISTSTYHRATKCNKNSCHEYGPPLETITTEVFTTEEWIDHTETITLEYKRNVKTYIINMGASYAVHETVFVYAGPGIMIKGDNKQFNGNIGVLYNSGSFGADFGFNTATDRFTFGFNFVF